MGETGRLAETLTLYSQDILAANPSLLGDYKDNFHCFCHGKVKLPFLSKMKGSQT